MPRLNELFKSVCERYEVAVTNREKIDEALTLFKKVLEVDMNASLFWSASKHGRATCPIQGSLSHAGSLEEM